MKFALVNGVKEQATNGATGQCLNCGSDLVAKCGEVRIHHWAHKGNRNCDPWWENETEWHRLWKSCFPQTWQEVVHCSETGERHIADVKTEDGWALEFQHSFLKPEERRSRNEFYPKLIWVVDGTRRKTDKKQFQKILNESSRLPTSVPIFNAHFPDECRLLKEWIDSSSLVFFDFQEPEAAEKSMLWFVFPRTPSAEIFLSPFSRSSFVELLNNRTFDELIANTIQPIFKEMVNWKRGGQARSVSGRANALSGFEQHMARKRRQRRRF